MRLYLGGQGQGHETWVEMLQKQSWECLWMHELLSGSYLLLIFLSHFQKLTGNLCCLTEQSGKLGCLKTTFFICVEFCGAELRQETPGEGGRGGCLLGQMAESREERQAWALAMELQGRPGFLYLHEIEPPAFKDPEVVSGDQ